MHQKYKNFFVYVADTYLQYFSPTSGDDETSKYIRILADDKSEYKKFHFGYLGLLCNNEEIKPKIIIVRNIHSQEEQINTLLVKVREWTKLGKSILDRIDAIPDNELKEIITKVSRYVSLFTSMYFPKQIVNKN